LAEAEWRKTLGILAWIVFGLIVGLVARWIIPGEAPGGLIGGWIYGVFGHVGVTGFNLPSMLCALIGAIVLLWLLRAIRGRPAV
jgi:uncharacterized membrane protein YeaQ/YmgE (transglycosylase-associated protein family)